MIGDLPGRIHLIGIGGAGMSALAKILAGRGHVVSGSDLRAGTALQMLGDLGVEVWEGHRPSVMSEMELVVASSAVPDSDPELQSSVSAGVTTWRRPRLLQEITSSVPTIGPSGTHGKTTTTAMLVCALHATGSDPSFVVGGQMAGYGTNAHLGEDDLLVLEVDEAFGTFEHVALGGLIVTNVEADHMDHFGTADALEESFVGVVRRVDGPVIACLDDPGAATVAARTGAMTYGTDPAATWRLENFATRRGRGVFDLVGPQDRVKVDLPRPGLHIARNAAGTLALLAELGHDLALAAEGLGSFLGVRRRFETRGVVAGVHIIDDYAHHPTEVRASLDEAAQYEATRVWAVFQPHLYSRTLELYREFGAALAQADGVIVTDVFGSREAPIPGVTGRLVAEATRRASRSPVHYIHHRSEVASQLVDLVAPGDLVLTMGAGDVTLVASELANALATGRLGDLR